MVATDVVFPFYEILVNSIFGSIGLAIVGVAVILALILFLCRTSWIFLLFWMTFYFVVMGTLYIGALGLVLSFFIVTIYTIVALMRLVAGNWINI